MPTPDEIFKEAENLRRAGNTAEAIAKYLETLTADEGNVLAHMSLGVLFCKVGKYQEAIAHSERACELEPKEPFNYTALSVTYQKTFEATQDRTYIYKAEEAKAKAHSIP